MRQHLRLQLVLRGRRDALLRAKTKAPRERGFFWRKTLRKLSWFAFLTCILANSSHATMIVVVYTNDGYWIGADSARSAQGKRVQTVCKIHATRFGNRLKSGNTQGTHLSGETYSTDEEVQSILNSSPDSEEFEARLRSAFKSDVGDELSYTLNNPNVNGRNVETTPMFAPIPKSLVLWLQRDVSLFPNGNPSGVLLEVRPQSDPILVPTPFGPRTMYKYWAPARFSWHSIDDLRLSDHT